MDATRATRITIRLTRLIACLLAGLFVHTATAADRAVWMELFADGDISDWTIENPYKPGDDPVTIELSSEQFALPPYSLHVHGPYADDSSGRLTGPLTGVNLTEPYTVSFMFRYENAHWFHIVHFGHVVFLVDFPSLRPQTVTEDGWEFCGVDPFRDYCPPNRWTHFRFEVDPPNQRWDLYVDGTHRVGVNFGNYMTDATGFRITETSGGPAQPDYVYHAYYDNIIIQGWDAVDCNDNGIHDGTDIVLGNDTDCNANGIPDQCDIDDGASADHDANGLPDECQVDCNDNTVWDYEEINLGTVDDCNLNGIPDECEIADEPELDCNHDGLIDLCQMYGYGATIPDCNHNLVPDSCDIADGASIDINGNGVPDECEIDCNRNGVPDAFEIADLTAPDCNGNGVPDECDIGLGIAADCNLNGIPDQCEIDQMMVDDCDGDGVPDECQDDCDDNGIADACDILFGGAPDCNYNGVPDFCDIHVFATSEDLDFDDIPDECFEDCNANTIPDVDEVFLDPLLDCNRNGIPDDCDINVYFTSSDVNVDGVPDECEDDCNGNGIDDYEDVLLFGEPDCNDNLVPDDCDLLFSATSTDCNVNGIPDECDVPLGHSPDCNNNAMPDECEAELGLSTDCNFNGVPDECEVWFGEWEDCNGNFLPDSCDLESGSSSDCNANGIPDECDIAMGGGDCDLNGILDECEGCVGDLDMNGYTDQHDLMLLLCGWGFCPDPMDCPGDVNCDGVVEIADFLLILQWWGCGVETVPAGDDPGVTLHVQHTTVTAPDKGRALWDVFDLSAQFADPAAQLRYIHSAHITPSTGAFMQYPQFGTDFAPLALWVQSIPLLAWDSFITIGVEQNAGVDETDTLQLDTAAFNAVTGASLDGTWVDKSCGGTGQGTLDGDNRVLFARLTLENASEWDTLEGEILLAWVDGGGTWKFTKVSLYRRVGDPGPCPWDATGDEGIPDGAVNTDDFFALLQHWGPCPDAPEPCPWDTTGDLGTPDGVINTDDFFALLQHWGNCGP
jgi:hypothetical protein